MGVAAICTVNVAIPLTVKRLLHFLDKCLKESRCGRAFIKSLIQSKCNLHQSHRGRKSKAEERSFHATRYPHSHHLWLVKLVLGGQSWWIQQTQVPAYSADVHWLEEWASLRFPLPCGKFSKGNYDWARQCYSWWCQCQASLEEIASEISVLYLKGYQSLWNSLPDMNGNGSLYHSHPASGVVPTKIVSWPASQWQSRPHSARAWSSG